MMWVILFLIVCLIGVIVYYKLKISKLTNNLNEILDHMLKEEPIPFVIDQESMDSKLHFKLKRILELLNDKTERSKQDHEQMQSLISDISHQVKTPVANLKMVNQIISERELTEKQLNECISLLSDPINKIEFLMEALIKISRLEKGILSFNPETILVNQLVADSLGDILFKADLKKIDIEVDCPKELIVICDKKWTKEAIINILDNAVKYTQIGGTIKITAEKRECYSVIRVIDNGVGIEESEQPMIFSRFYRSKEVKDNEGVGIGLYLSRQIIMQQQGFIYVKSKINCGSEFLIYLKSE